MKHAWARHARISLAIVAAVAWTAAGHSQTPGEPKAPVARTVNLTLEQRHVIRELVKELKVGHAPDVAVAAGDQVPSKADPLPMPTLIGQKVPQIKSHRLYVTDRQIVIVDPQEQKVVEVIE